MFVQDLAAREVRRFSRFISGQCGRRLCLVAALAAILLVAVQPGWAIVTSDDPDSPHHLVQPDSAYNMVGYFDLLGGTTGVLIGPRHVLTAGHVVSSVSDPTSISFRLDLPDGSHSYGVSERYVHPDADLALLTLADRVGLSGYALYRDFDEVGKTAAIVGYGNSGTGLTGGVLPRGTKRIAWNRIDRDYTPLRPDNDVLGYDFDQFDGDNDGPWDGDSLGETVEGLVSTGDSGGGLFLDMGGEPVLAGIHSWVISPGGTGILGFYGDYAFDVRVSKFLDWISEHVPGDANQDGRVEGSDYTIWADHYGETAVPAWSEGGWAYGNFNEDSIVDGADYTLWADNYLFGTGFNGGADLPEPNTALLLVLGAGPRLLGACRQVPRRRRARKAGTNRH